MKPHLTSTAFVADQFSEPERWHGDIDPAYNRAMPNRSLLHELVDSLPEAALAVAQGALEHFQTWPPQRPAQLDDIRKANMDRMRRSMRSGTVGGGGGGGGHFMGPGGRIEYGGHSHTHWEGDAVVATTHRYYAGHELVIQERIRLVDGGAHLTYSHSVTGPDATNDSREITFSVLG